MPHSDFNNLKVTEVSSFLQNYMKANAISQLSADECAELLAKAGILPNDVGPKPGFNFRQMLRDGRDGCIDLVEGAYQERPNSRWHILRKDN